MWEKEKKVEFLSRPSFLDSKNIQYSLLLNWEEHGLECTLPEKDTPLSLLRTDGLFSHFTYGIYPNPAFKGLFPFGADIRFRHGAKLEADLEQISLKVRPFWNLLLQKLMRSSHRVTHSFFYRIRQVRNILKLSRNSEYDELVIECFSPEQNIFRLILECYLLAGDKRVIKFRHSFNVKPGHNFYTIPAREFELGGFRYLYLYPDNGERECRLIFTWLDFVRYWEKDGKRVNIDLPVIPKIKCIAWDLDNTLWNGILAESGIERVKMRTESIETIKKFDALGIIQTIASKNSFEDAWEIITNTDLQDYFIYPAINWGQKSENLKMISKKLNISLDTFGLIDDSNFERAEVSNALPQVRTYSDTEIGQLFEYPEFDVSVTEASRMCRMSYLAEMKREELKATYSGNYDEFVQSWEMKLNIFIPRTEQQISRCFELLQRSNQLNLTGRRYTREEFDSLLKGEKRLSVGFQCSDKFGNYGIIGFCSIDEGGDAPVVEELAISCRVAQRKVEQTFFQWLVNQYRSQKGRELRLRFVKTQKNTPLLNVVREMSFDIVSENGGVILFTVPLKRTFFDKQFMSIKTQNV